MRNVWRIAAFVALGACGIPEDKFGERYVETYCDAWEQCNTAGEPCPITVGETGVSADCDYDSKAASDCIHGAWECDDSFGEGFELIKPPAECEAVCPIADTGTPPAGTPTPTPTPTPS